MLIRCSNSYVLYLKEKVLELLKGAFQLVFASSELSVSTQWLNGLLIAPFECKLAWQSLSLMPLSETVLTENHNKFTKIIIYAKKSVF